jgi:hypothetical protein
VPGLLREVVENWEAQQADTGGDAGSDWKKAERENKNRDFGEN